MSIERIRRRCLPHWDVSGAPYFVTSCLKESIPAKGLLDISKYRMELESRPKPEHASAATWKLRQWKLTFAKTDEWLDAGSAARHLADPRLAQIVVNAFLLFCR